MNLTSCLERFSHKEKNDGWSMVYDSRPNCNKKVSKDNPFSFFERDGAEAIKGSAPAAILSGFFRENKYSTFDAKDDLFKQFILYTVGREVYWYLSAETEFCEDGTSESEYYLRIKDGKLSVTLVSDIRDVLTGANTLIGAMDFGITYDD